MVSVWQRIRALMSPASAAATGQLFVVAAPSGAGKTSLVNALVAQRDDLRISVSFTTRPRRANEVDGKDYFFVSPGEFERLRRGDDLLEYAQVFDNFYGTSKSQVQALFDAGNNVMLEIDWQGARQVRTAMPQSTGIFILPPSREALEHRLRARSTDTDAVIARRLRDSVADMSHWEEFEYIVVNDDFDTAVNELTAILDGSGEALRSSRPQLEPLIRELLA